MIKRFLFDWLCKEYIEQEIEERFREQTIGRHFQAKARELRRRTDEFRKLIDSQITAR
tara:strand:+ start:10908 stop:11081 length:174 start_codon:yes stop_codon:yes gene_type:complete